MRLLDAQLPPDINIYSFGDTHEEYIGCYEDGINQFVETVHDDPMGHVIFGGDAFETQYPTHKYYDPRTLRKNAEQNPITVGEQIRLSAIKYLPIKDRILAWHIGNHELRVIGVINLGQALLSELDIPHVYAGYSSKVAIKDSKGKKWFKIYTNHGTNMAQSRAGSERQKQTNQAVSLINRLAPLTGDCLVMQMFHTHRLIVVNPLRRLYLVDDGKKIKQKYITTKPSDDYIDPENRFYINGGSFFRSQVVGGDTYAERAMYPPTEMGYAKIIVRDYQVVDVEKVTI